MVIPVCKQMQKYFYYDAFILKITEWKTIIQTHSEDDYNKGVREDHYEIAKILLSNISATITNSEIVKIWQIVVSCGIKNHYVILISDRSHYRDDKITSNVIIQQAPISLCSNTSDNRIINGARNFNLGHITKIRGAELYTLNLQELNNNRMKYVRAHGMIKKTIDLALATNSYEELVGICQDFLANKQRILDNINHQVKEILNNDNIANPIITARKGRPAGRIKSAVEIQDKGNKRNYLRTIKLNIQRGGNETQLDNKDNRKTYQNCEQKGYDCTTCKSTG
ncbi:hypothetical protein RclHR1_00270007 [Rhizophagus clarus]|uniref:Uncharacterized protein n=1 Tax=Rhizophagus clarus TaxID=94130 RepID=A0A2Z6RGX9_9GLOM|nr:hypothetical protein RclHR1_00270007 [Rhizophagus clarus]GES85454.1 hypothetical protein GLOIN_2v1474313 [Rhizophagus clarus]